FFTLHILQISEKLSEMSIPDPSKVCRIDKLSYTDNHAFFGPWDNFVTSFIATFSNHISPDVINEIGDFLFGEGLFSNAAFDLLTSQPTFLFFFWLGVIISAVSIAGAVLLLIPSTRYWSTKHVSSKTMNLTGMILAVVSFCFVGTAIGLYSIPPLVSKDANEPRTTPFDIYQVKENLRTFMKSKTDNDCFTAITFQPIIDQTTTLTNTVMGNVDNNTGLQAAAQIDYNELGKQLSGNASQIRDIIADLKTAALLPNIASNDLALEQVNDAVDQYNSILNLLQVGMPTTLSRYGAEVSACKNDVDKAIRDNGNTAATFAKNNINEVFYDVSRAVGAADTAMVTTESLIATAVDNINSGMSQMQQTYSYGGTAAFALVLIFLIFALISSIAGIVCSIIFMSRKSSTPSTRTANTLFVFAIIVLVLISFVFGPTLLMMIMGYSVQTSCQPFFYDDNLKGLQTMAPHLPHFAIPTMEADVIVNTSFVDVMRSCKTAYFEGSTPFFYVAVGGNMQVLDESKMQNAMNFNAVFNQFKNNVDAAVIRTIDRNDYDYISESITEIASTPNLQYAYRAAPDDIGDILDKADQFESDMKPLLDECRAALDDTKDYFSELHVKDIIDDEMKKALQTINGAMYDGATNLYNFLYSGGESCGNLYRSWADAGDLGCRETNIIWHGQGMWPAAGLAGLFFLPLALSLVCIANAHRHGKEVLLEIASYSPKVQEAAQPVPVIHHQQPAPHLSQAPPAIPTRSASRDPWQ
ncbi:hypothetical protein PRIPAC_88546, partial [Pristionchus pacificus]